MNTTVTAENFCFKVTDGTHDSPSICNQGERFPLITSKHLVGKKIDFSRANMISKEDYENINKRSRVEQWDILFSMIGTVGRCYLETNANINYACKNVAIFKFNGRQYDAKWFYYYLQSPKCRAQIEALSRGTTQSYVPLNALRNLKIDLPTRSVRDRVVDVLYNFDEKIEINKRIISNLESQIQIIYSEKFVDISDSTPAKLGDILSLRQEKILSKDVGSLPYVPIDSLPCKSFAIDSYRPSNEAKSSLIKFNKDDILIGAMRVYFHRVVPAPVNGVTRTTCMVLTPKEPEYFAYCLATCNQKSCIDYAQSISKGSTMPYAYWLNGLSEYKINLPRRDDIVSFQKMTLPIVRYIQSLAVQNSKLNEMRDILLPKLISGEIHLKR